MTPTGLDNGEATRLQERITTWVEAGVISSDQAEGIRRFERVADSASPQRLNLGAEVAAYVGSVLALMGGGAFVGSSWDDLRLLGRVAVGVVVMALGFAAGTWLVHLGERGTTRLGWFLWVVGTGGVGITALAVGNQVWSHDGDIVAVTVGVLVMGVSVALWRNLERPLQLLTAAVGCGIALAGASEMADLPTWAMSFLLIVLGIGLTIGAVGRMVRPLVIALGLGGVSGYVGSLMLTEMNERVGTGMALVVAIAVIVVALREHTVPVLVLGVGGTLIATQGLLSTTFTGAASALIVIALGVIIVVGVVVSSMRRPDVPKSERSQPPTA